MKIVAAQIHSLRIGVERPHQMAIGTTFQQQNVVLRLTSEEGEHGYGEAKVATALNGAFVPVEARAATRLAAPRGSIQAGREDRPRPGRPRLVPARTEGRARETPLCPLEPV